MFCSLCYSSTAWWAWGRNAALSHSPEPALPEPQEGSSDPVYRPLIRNLTLFSPHSQRTATRLFSRDTGIKTGSRTMGGGRGRKHNTESKSTSKGDTERHSPLFRVPGCIVLFRYVTALFLRFGERRRRGDWLNSMAITNTGSKLKAKLSRPSNSPTSQGWSPQGLGSLCVLGSKRILQRGLSLL